MRRTLVVWLFLSPALFAGERFTVDHRKANVDGKQALMEIPKLPVIYQEDLVDCRAMLAPANAPEQRRLFPCGSWYVPPAAGQYLLWLENEVGISSSQSLLIYSDSPYEGAGWVAAHDLVPAGHARVQNTVSNGHTARYLHLDSSGVGFQLRVAGSDAGMPVRLPEGRVVVGIFDPEGRAVAYSRPSIIKAGETTTFLLKPPEKGADLVVILRKPKTRRARTADLEAAGRRPDVHYEKSSHVVAVWYGMPPVPTTVTSEALDFRKEVALKERAVTTVRETVKD